MGWFPDGWFHIGWWEDEWWPEYGVGALAGAIEVSYNMPDVNIEIGEVTTNTEISINEIAIQVVMTE